MNDTMSLVLATTVLAIGGLGLYMFKSSEDDYDEQPHKKGGKKGKSNSDEYSEDFMNTSSWWGNSDADEPSDDESLEDLEDEEEPEPAPTPRKRAANKTQRNRKSGGSRRRY